MLVESESVSFLGLVTPGQEDLKALCMLGKCSKNELQPKPEIKPLQSLTAVVQKFYPSKLFSTKY